MQADEFRVRLARLLQFEAFALLGQHDLLQHGLEFGLWVWD